ncbi:MAG: B12-binding domain-containing radical SAM protein [Elusimicrobiota bacterium]
MAKIILIEPATETREGVMRILASIGSNKINWKFAPIDLLGIGGILRKNGFEDFLILDALNLELSHQQTKEYIEKEKPELVVFIFTIYTIDNDMKVATMAKQVSKEIKTMAVNFAAESYSGSIMNDFMDLDFLAYHEPEYPVMDIIKADFNPENVAGIYYRKTGKIYKNPEKPLLNLDDIGIMTHDKIPLHIYRSPYQKRTPMSSTSFSRGCINMCAHCIGKYLSLYNGGHMRFKTVDNCIEELHFLEKLGVKELRLFDSELNADLDWSNELFDRIISEKIDITYSCNLRADNINEQFLMKLKKSGCHLVSIGFDSVSQEILDNMKKNLTVKQITDSVNLVKKIGLRFSTFTTFGHKGETKQTMLDTIKMIKKINPDMASFTLAVPILGTEFYDFLKKNKYLDENATLKTYDPNYHPVYSYPNLSSKEMYEYAMYGYRSFYFRPAYILKRLFHSSNLINDFKYLGYFIQRYVFEPLKIKKVD